MAAEPVSSGFIPSNVASADLPLQTLFQGAKGTIGKSIQGASAWQIALALFLVLVTYDQRKCHLFFLL